MNKFIEPQPIYRALTEEEVRKALADLNSKKNPIIVEIYRLIASYTKTFIIYFNNRGYVPLYLLHRQPRWPIEKVAMEFTELIVRISLPIGNNQ